MADGKVTIDVLLDDKGAVKGVAGLERVLGGVTNAAEKVTGSVKNIVGALGLVKLAGKAFDMVRSSMDAAITRVDILNRFPQMMEAMGFSAEQSQSSIKRLSEGIQGLPTRLDEVASSAQQIAIMTGDIDKATETTLALNNAFLASGSDSANASRGLQQYVQMLAKGEVDMQSWRTLQETMGVALNDTAKAFGFAGASAQNDLYDALKDGTITFDEFNDKIIELSNSTGGFAERALIASKGIKTSFTNIKTAVATGLANMIQTVNDTMEAEGFGSIADNLDKVKVKVQQGFRGMNEGLKVAIPAILGTIRGMNAVMQVAFDEGVAAADRKAKELMQNFLEGLHQSTDNQAFKKLIQTMLALTEGDFGAAKQAARDLMEAFLANLYWATESPALREVSSLLLKALSGDVSGAKIAAIELMTKFIDGLRGSLEKVLQIGINIVYNLADGIIRGYPLFFRVNNQLIQTILDVILAMVPVVFEAGTQLVGSLVDSVKAAIPMMWDAADDTISGYIDVIVNNLPEALASGSEFILAFLEGITTLLPLVVTAALGVVAHFVEELAIAVPGLLDTGMQFVWSLVDGILNALPDIGNVAIQIVSWFITMLVEYVPQIIQTGVSFIQSLIDGIIQRAPAIFETMVNILGGLLKLILEKLPSVIDAGVQIILSLIDGLFRTSPQSDQAMREIMRTLVDVIIALFPVVLECGVQIIWSLIKGIVQIAAKLWETGSDLMKGLIRTIISFYSEYISSGARLVSGIASGIAGSAGKVVNAISGVISGAWQTVTAFFGRFRDAGANIVGMIADGIWGAIGKVTDAIGSVTSKIRNFLPFSPAKEGPLRDLNKLNFGGTISEGIYDGEIKIQRAMEHILTVPQLSYALPDFGSVMASAAKSSQTSQTVTNNNQPTIHIEKIENYSDSDIPRILEESAWIMSREEKRL